MWVVAAGAPPKRGERAMHIGFLTQVGTQVGRWGLVGQTGFVIRATTRERYPGACRSRTPKFTARHMAFDSAADEGNPRESAAETTTRAPYLISPQNSRVSYSSVGHRDPL